NRCLRVRISPLGTTLLLRGVFRGVIAENQICIYRTFSEEKLIEATSKQRSHCVLNRKSAGASEEFVDTKNFGLGAKSGPWAHKTLRGGCIRRSKTKLRRHRLAGTT